MANTPSLRDLMAAGAHFGHKRERSHPKAKSYIYTLREGIYIIDLEKTREALEKALKVLGEWAADGKTILFVGTKPQAADLVKAAAEKAGMPYITHRWPGGLLTNFETVVQNLKNLDTLESNLNSDQYVNWTKKERRVLSEKIRKNNETLGGIRTLRQLPDALFVVDVVAEATAVEEAHRLGLPIVGVCDTNANPDRIDYPIPANDDARKSVELVTDLVAETIVAHKRGPVVAKVEETKTETVVAPEKTTEKTVEKAEAGTEEKPKRARTTKKEAAEVTEQVAAE